MIVARFMASAIICRIIVAYELAGLTAAEETKGKGPPKSNSRALDSEKSKGPASAGSSAYDRYCMGV
jgi:hypothetical protein